MPEHDDGSTESFREGAVRIVRETNEPIASVADDLGSNPGRLGNWLDRDRVNRGESDALTTDDGAELARRRAEVHELRMERGVLTPCLTL